MADKQTIKFGDICKEVKLTTKDPIGDGYERYIGLEHLDSGSLKIKRWGIISEDNPSFTRVFKKGQILFGRRRAYLKKAAIAEFDGICSGDIIVMESTPNSRFKTLLPYIVHSEPFWNWAIKNSAGGLSPRTKFKSLAEFTFDDVDDPTLAMRKESFDKLSSLFELSDLSRNSLETLSHVLINGLTRFGVYNEELKNTKAGDVPESWDVLPFKAVFDVDTKNGLYKQKNHYGRGPKMVHMGEMFKSRTIVEDDIENAVEVDDKELLGFGLNNGDLLFARRSLTKEGAGLCCIYKGKNLAATFESSIIRVRLEPKKANPDFYNYFFRSQYGRWLMARIIQTVAASGITSTDLKNMYVPIPSLKEQNKIVEILDSLIMSSESFTAADVTRSNVLTNLIHRTVN
ncbi:restriction endonuclease subunit S [Photobacterium kishitanii]|uniref:restriction endonuclease subunit S n=1 Tax=Photobacterium kishitanii TaxID=318456 RepID=UPI0009BCFC85|nr:restriction endonuclease subunit S [Photobacterium kishitanii]PSW49503.1 type I restriction endonuclease subunit S [Photobacterium kishitanii]